MHLCRISHRFHKTSCREAEVIKSTSASKSPGLNQGKKLKARSEISVFSGSSINSVIITVHIEMSNENTVS